ncbi:MAG: hypothetical protein ACHQFX_01660 [Chitinophagales bacterium]
MSTKTTVLFFLTGILTASELLAQRNANLPKITNGKSNAASVGIDIPVGEFSQTHFAGITLGYSWSHHRFGVVAPKKPIGFTANGGIGCYFGKRSLIAGYEYRYSNYIFLHAFGGALFNPGKKGYIALTTGVAAGIYKEAVHPGLGAKLGAGYLLTGMISLAGSFSFLKYKDASGLCSAGIRVEYSF